MLVIVDKIPVCVLDGLTADGQFYDEAERLLICREAVERGVVKLREAMPELLPQECVLRVIKAVCLAANHGNRDNELESQVMAKYMIHHSVVERFLATENSNSWYPIGQGDS